MLRRRKNLLTPPMLRWALLGIVIGGLACRQPQDSVDTKTNSQQNTISWVVHEFTPQQSVPVYGFEDRTGALRVLKETTAALYVYTGVEAEVLGQSWRLVTEASPSDTPPDPSMWRFIKGDAPGTSSQTGTTSWSIAVQGRVHCPVFSIQSHARPFQVSLEGVSRATLPLSANWQLWFDEYGELRLGSSACQRNVQLARDYIAKRTAGFYTTGLAAAVAAFMQKHQSPFMVSDDSTNQVKKAAAYQLQARGLLNKEGNELLPVDEALWAEVAARASRSLTSYTFHGLTQDPNQELSRLTNSQAFAEVLQETPASDGFIQLQHHGHIWVPLMTLLNHGRNTQGQSYLQALISSTGLNVSDMSPGSIRAMDLLIADGAVAMMGQKYVATLLGQDALPKVARWAGLLASYYGLGDAERVAQQFELPSVMVAVDDRHLNVASSGAGLQRFAESFVLPQLANIEGLRAVVGVGSGSGGLERMIYDRFGTGIDIFGSDLDEQDSEGRHSLEVAREALADIVPASRIFAADIRDPQNLVQRLREQYREEGLSDAEINDRVAHMAVTSGFITHEPRSFSPSEVTTMLNGYASYIPHFILLEIPLVDPAVHALQPDAHFGVEIGTFHLASGQTIRPLEQWYSIIAASNYRIVAEASFNKIWNPNTNRYDIPTYVGLHLSTQ